MKTQRSVCSHPRQTVTIILLMSCLIGQKVVVDGQTLVSVNLGGSQFDAARAIATDSAGNIYVVGETYSNDFPRAGPSSHSRAAGDAFIVKLNGSATQILYSVVFGGSNYDSARGVAVDSSGNAYITGFTNSVDFPVTAGALQQSSPSPGLQHAFIGKVNSLGGLVYASYLGGASNDAGYAIAVDPSGAVYVAGSTSSQNFPVTSNALQRLQRGISNCFIAKVDTRGASLLYATFLGGERNDLCRGIAVDGAGEAYVTGVTNSSYFPVAAALNSTLSGSSDAFLAKLSPAGNQLLFSTYLGGESVDEGNAIAIGSSGVVYVAGDTASSAFPTSSKALQPNNRGGTTPFSALWPAMEASFCGAPTLAAADLIPATLCPWLWMAASSSLGIRRRRIFQWPALFRAPLAAHLMLSCPWLRRMAPLWIFPLLLAEAVMIERMELRRLDPTSSCCPGKYYRAQSRI